MYKNTHEGMEAIIRGSRAATLHQNFRDSKRPCISKKSTVCFSLMVGQTAAKGALLQWLEEEFTKM